MTLVYSVYLLASTYLNPFSSRLQMTFDHLLNLSMSYHTRRKTGEVLRVSTYAKSGFKAFHSRGRRYWIEEALSIPSFRCMTEFTNPLILD